MCLSTSRQTYFIHLSSRDDFVFGEHLSSSYFFAELCGETQGIKGQASFIERPHSCFCLCSIKYTVHHIRISLARSVASKVPKRSSVLRQSFPVQFSTSNLRSLQTRLGERREEGEERRISVTKPSSKKANKERKTFAVVTEGPDCRCTCVHRCQVQAINW